MKRVTVTHWHAGDRRTVADAKPTMVASEAGVNMRVPAADGHWNVWLPGPLLREALDLWREMPTFGLRVRMRVVSTKRGDAVAFEKLPAERQRSFERLIRGWREGAEESLARWLEAAGDSEEAELERVNVLRRKLGLADV